MNFDKWFLLQIDTASPMELLTRCRILSLPRISFSIESKITSFTFFTRKNVIVKFAMMLSDTSFECVNADMVKNMCCQ